MDIKMNESSIRRMLEYADLGPGMEVLDAACGDGSLFPFYLELGVARVVGVESSSELAKAAADSEKAEVICADVEEITSNRLFDRVILYNALPQFPYPKRLVKKLASLLKNGGKLTIAHNLTEKGSDGLIPVEELKKIFDKFFDVEVMICSGSTYQVTGTKRDPLEHVHCGVTHTHDGYTHTHSHGDEAHDHHPAPDATPMDELLVLMKYLVNHNDAHAQEIAELAGSLLTAGKATAYDEVMDAVADFDIVNAKLDSILCRLTVEEDF